MSASPLVHAEHVWGTVVSVHVPLHRTSPQTAQAGINQVVAFLHAVDETFSTFKPTSAVSRLRSGQLDESNVESDVSDVIERCRRMRELTGGSFDPWSALGGFDPSSLVKGWAADRAADILAKFGAVDCMIAAGGDVTVRGQSAAGSVWTIGLQHPDQHDQIYASIEVTDCAVATSGLYERGNHINANSIAASSATVVGPDGATADALATALLIDGITGFDWLSRLPGYSGQVVIDNEVTSYGTAFAATGT